MQPYAVDKLMSEARRLAAEYRRATGRPLAIGGEIAKHDAMRLLDLEAASDEDAGFDARGRSGDRAGVRFLVKNRAIFDDKTGQRVGQIKLSGNWDRVLLVLLDDQFEAFEIHEATREAIEAAYEKPTAPGRSKRGALSVARFKAIGQLAWSAAGSSGANVDTGVDAGARVDPASGSSQGAVDDIGRG